MLFICSLAIGSNLVYGRLIMQLEPPAYIETTEELTQWVNRLDDQSLIAVDTESDSFHHYQEKVCLIQMTACGEDVLIDPLAIDDISCLAPVFNDPNRIKIFHDAGYDLVCLGRDFGFEFQGLFDTMLASRLIGAKRFGLASLLKENFDFEADKTLQRSDWAKRPLSSKQIRYARFDTHFLLQITEMLTEQLKEKGRWSWAEEDFARLPAIAKLVGARSPANDPEGFWRIKGIRGMTPPVIGRIKALYLARDTIAQRIDRPAFKVFNNDLIVALAKKPPKTLGELGPRPGLRKPGVDRFGPEILTALENSEPFTGEAPKNTKRRRSGRFMDPHARQRYESLRELRKSVAAEYELDPEVMMGNATLEEFAQTPPKSPEEVGINKDIKGWREPIFAKRIFDQIDTLEYEP